MRRRLLRWGAIGFIAAVILFTLADIVLRLLVNSTWLESEIRDRMREETGRQAGLEQASVSLTRGLIIKEFYMLEPAPSALETFSFAKAEIGVSLWGLMRRELEIDSLTLTAPHLDIVIGPDGQTNLSDILARLRGGDDEEDSEADGGAEESSRSEEGRDEGEVLNGIRSLRVIGGSISLLRETEATTLDPYLDLTDLSLTIENLTTEAPFAFRLSGNMSVERQSAFMLAGEVDPTTGRIEGTLSLPVLKPSLANDLMAFFQLRGWELAAGEIREIAVGFRTGEGYSPIDFDGESDFDELAARVTRGALFRVDGDVNLRASYEPSTRRLDLSRLEIENNRSGPDGEFRLTGSILTARGEADLAVRVEGAGPDNFQGLFPTAFVAEGDDPWIDINGQLQLTDGFRRSRFEGSLQAKSATLGMPAVADTAVVLDGLRISGQVTLNHASQEIDQIETIWTLPDAIAPEAPVALVGSTRTALGLDLSNVSLAGMSRRLVPLEAPRGGDSPLLDLVRRQRGEGRAIPIGFVLPPFSTEGLEWERVRGTLRLAPGGLELADVTGFVDGGRFQLRGPIGRSARRGALEVENFPLAGVLALWPGVFDSLETGRFTGRLAASHDLEEDLLLAAIDCDVDGATVTGHWVLEELADFTGIEALQSWSRAGLNIVAAHDNSGWHIENLLLERADLRLALDGEIEPQGEIDLVARLAMPAAAVRRLPQGARFQGTQAQDGWQEMILTIEGRAAQPNIRRVASDAVPERPTAASLRDIFRALDLEPPDGLRVDAATSAVIEPAVADETPAERPQPALQPLSPPTPLERPAPAVDEEETPTEEPDPGPQLPPPAERPSEIVE